MLQKRRRRILECRPGLSGKTVDFFVWIFSRTPSVFTDSKTEIEGEKERERVNENENKRGNREG